MTAPTVDFTPPKFFIEQTFTNTTGTPADALDVFSGSHTGMVVSSLTPGCGVPTMGPPEFVRIEFRPGIDGGPAPLYNNKVRWPSACVDNGESVTVQFEIGVSISAVVAFGLPITSVFFDSSIATMTPTNTPVTPSATPTSTPFPAPGISLVLDCDVNTAGIQSTCTVPLDAGVVDVDVVLINNGPAFTLAAMNFDLEHPVTARLDAQPSLPCAAPGLDCNPDFNQVSLSGAQWSCAPPFPNDDYDPGPAERSYIGCVNAVDPEPIGEGESITLATVRYDIAPGATVGGPEGLTLSVVNLATEMGNEVLACGPGTGTCLGASVALGPAVGLPTLTPTPTATVVVTPPPATPQIATTPSSTPTVAAFIALDCAVDMPGIQSECTYLTTDTFIDVGVVSYVSPSMGSFIWGAVTFRVLDPDTSRLFPPPGEGLDVDRNPDLNQAVLGSGVTCLSVEPPDNDTGEFGPGTASSELDCLTSFGLPMQTGTAVRVGTVRYAVVAGAAPGAVELELRGAEVVDELGVNLTNCPFISSAWPTCPGANITLIDPPPAPLAIHKIPEGVGDNTDLSVPAANLWICELGPCDGPGEGALRVVEHATSVQDGLGAYEFTVEYDNFVISSVNSCDIVFGPGGAGSARGPVDELDTSAVNDDCLPDPGAGGGTCSYSHILENVIHFGCATVGQAPGPTGDFALASLLLIPHEDLANDLFPGNENGVLTIIKDNGCELVDILGHPVTGSINGGLTPECGDLAVTVRILEGDLDLNCEVDVTDAQLIAGKYGAFFGSLLYSKWYDLEPALHDLDIDIKDLQKVFGRDGSTCQQPVPPQPPLPYPF
jgi:hypothetical protein